MVKNHKGKYLLPSRLKELVPNNEVELLVNGEEFFPSLINAISNAQESIYMDFYKISDDKTGRIIGEILREKASKGLEVCIIYDAIGSFNSKEYFRWLEASGVMAIAFNPVSLLRSRFGINRRDHRKMAIIDGEIGFLGGMNIAEEYGNPENNWKGWRDTAVCVRGNVVRQMTKIFHDSWRRLGGYSLKLIGKYDNMVKNVESARVDEGMMAFVVGTERVWRRREAIRTYRKAIWNARKTIRIQSAYFIPPYTMRFALRKASARGVNIKIIVPLYGDLILNQFASRHTFEGLMKAGIEIYQLEGPIMHTKTAIVDGIWCTVGSFNNNHRSFFHDIELNLLVVDETFAAKMEEVFREDLKRSIPIDPRKWKERPMGEKILERICYFLRHWL